MLYYVSKGITSYALIQLLIGSRQIHAAFKGLLGEQIRHKLIAFESQTKPSKINSVIKNAKTANRSVAFKAARLSDSIFEHQSEILLTEAATVNYASHEEDLDVVVIVVGCS